MISHGIGIYPGCSRPSGTSGCSRTQRRWLSRCGCKCGDLFLCPFLIPSLPSLFLPPFPPSFYSSFLPPTPSSHPILPAIFSFFMNTINNKVAHSLPYYVISGTSRTTRTPWTNGFTWSRGHWSKGKILK